MGIFDFLRTKKKSGFENTHIQSMSDEEREQRFIEFERELERRRAIPVSEKKKINEMIPDDVIKKVEKTVDKEFKGQYYLGLCYRIWSRERQLYAELGYEWYSPAEIHPDIIID